MLFLGLMIISLFLRTKQIYKLIVAMLLFAFSIIGSFQWANQEIYNVKKYDILEIRNGIANIRINNKKTIAMIELSNKERLQKVRLFSKFGLLTIPVETSYYILTINPEKIKNME